MIMPIELPALGQPANASLHASGAIGDTRKPPDTNGVAGWVTLPELFLYLFHHIQIT